MSKSRIGVVGLNSRAVGESAKKSGFGVSLVNYYSDVDVHVDSHFPMQSDPLRPDLGEYNAERMVDFAIQNLDGVDSILVTSAIGSNPTLLKRLGGHFRILGNDWKMVKRVKKWTSLRKILDSCGVNYPETKIGSAAGLGFPLVMKSEVEGTAKIRIVSREEDLIHDAMEEILFQKYVPGIPISVSLLSTGENAVVLSVNEQLIGMQEFNVNGLTYCGNLVPLDSGLEDVKSMAEKIILEAGLKGSCGVDFVVNKKRIYFMEINPRFQDTLEGVEQLMGINLVQEHIRAMNGILGEYETGYGCYGKGILFSDQELRVGDLRNIQGVRDIPSEGSLIQEGEPVCSVMSGGRNNSEVLTSLLKRVRQIKGLNRQT